MTKPSRQVRRATERQNAKIEKRAAGGLLPIAVRYAPFTGWTSKYLPHIGKKEIGRYAVK